VTASLIALLREGLMLALWLALPLLLAAAAAGLVAALLTRVAQLEDPTVAMVARVVGVGGALVLFGPSIAAQLQGCAARALATIAGLGAAGS